MEKMLDEFTGVPVKTVKTFMTKTPSVFTGKELYGIFYRQDLCERARSDLVQSFK